MFVVVSEATTCLMGSRDEQYGPGSYSSSSSHRQVFSGLVGALAKFYLDDHQFRDDALQNKSWLGYQKMGGPISD